MESTQEIIQRLLDERYEAGHEAGYGEGLKAGQDEGFEEGLKHGYKKAMFAIQDFVEAQLAPPGKPVRADHPGDENDGEPPRLIDCQAPYLQKAFRHLCANPGITAHEAGVKLGSKGAFYTLARLGLAEKRGSQFFPKDEASA